MRIAIILTVVLLSSNAGAFNFAGFGMMPSHEKPFHWYFDEKNGNDSNSGITQATALKTWAAVSVKYAANQRIGIARGSHIREQIDITKDNVTVAAYGNGAKPLLDCSDVISAGAWSKTVGQTNVYQATVPIVTGAAYIRTWENGTRYVRTASLAECDSTPGSMYVANDTTANTVLYIHAIDDTNPASDGKTYEYSRRNHGFFSSGVYTKLIGVKSWRNIHNDGSIKFGRYSTGIDLDADDGTKHNIYIGLGCNLIGCSAYDAYFPAGGTLYILYDGPVTGQETHSFINCSARMPVYSSTHAAFYGHGPVDYWAKVTLENCYAENCVEGCAFGSTELVHIIGGHFKDVGQTVNAVASLIIEGGFRATWSDTVPTDIIRMPAVGAENKYLTIRDSSFVAPPDYGINFVLTSATGSAGFVIDIQRSTFICTSVNARFIQSSVGDRTIISKYNTINVGSYYYVVGANSTITADYNTYQGTTTGNKVLPNGVNTTYAAWKLSGQDANSTP